MRLTQRNSAATLLLGATVAIGAAQSKKPDTFDFTVADIRILQDKQVQADMKVSSSQRDKMNAFAKQHTQKLQSYQKSLKDTKPTAENKKKVELQLVKYLQDLKKNVIGVLSATQLKRLREITLQGYGWSAVADDRVGKRVGMSAAQIKKAKSILSEAAKKSAGIERAATTPVLAPYKDKKPKNEAEAKQWNEKIKAGMQQAAVKIKPQIDAIQKKAIADIQAMMSKSQRASYLALQGKTFKGK
jgi:hypothetical protein